MAADSKIGKRELAAQGVKVGCMANGSQGKDAGVSLLLHSCTIPQHDGRFVMRA